MIVISRSKYVSIFFRIKGKISHQHNTSTEAAPAVPQPTPCRSDFSPTKWKQKACSLLTPRPATEHAGLAGSPACGGVSWTCGLEVLACLRGKAQHPVSFSISRLFIAFIVLALSRPPCLFKVRVS